jgi:hypothetical protein
MEDKDDYSKFTEERYQALYNRIYAKQENCVSTCTSSSRDQNKGFQYAKQLYELISLFQISPKLTEALESFESSYSLWHSMPEIMETLEPWRLKILEHYHRPWTSENIIKSAKTIERFKLFGFIPTLTKVKEIYNANRELLYAIEIKINFSLSKWAQFLSAKGKIEKRRILSTMYFETYLYNESDSLGHLETGIKGEPTRKKLFHAIVKYRAIDGFTQHLNNSDISQFTKNSDAYQTPTNTKTSEIHEPLSFEDNSNLETHETSRKRQAIAYYYLLNAGGVKGILSNKSEFARFMAFMSGSDSVDGNKTAANIYNTSYYRNIKLLFGSKTTQFNLTDLDAVIKQFKEMDQGQNSVLSQAIEQLIKDKESLE